MKITWNLELSNVSETVLVLASPVTCMSIQTLALRKSRDCRIFRTYFTEFSLPARCTFTSKGCFSVVLVTCSTSLTRLAKAWWNLKRNVQWNKYQNELSYSLSLIYTWSEVNPTMLRHRRVAPKREIWSDWGQNMEYQRNTVSSQNSERSYQGWSSAYLK